MPDRESVPSLSYLQSVWCEWSEVLWCEDYGGRVVYNSIGIQGGGGLKMGVGIKLGRW